MIKYTNKSILPLSSADDDVVTGVDVWSLDSSLELMPKIAAWLSNLIGYKSLGPSKKQNEIRVFIFYYSINRI